MSDNLPEISLDKYDLQEKWLKDIAPKYLDISNINHLKHGLFGYLNEIMSTVTRYNIAHRNFLYDEAFLNTASLTKSIYNKAKSYNYEIPLATPASFELTFSFPQSLIFTYGEREYNADLNSYTGNYTFTIEKENKFYIQNFPFSLENDITIKAILLNDGSYSYNARYNREEEPDNTGKFSGSNNPYITLWTDRNEQLEDLITIQIKVFQYEIDTIVYENFSSDLSDNLIFTKSYNNHICNFSVQYETQTQDISLNGYFNDAFVPDEEYYYYYSFDDTELTIYFSGLPNSFKPSINSKITLNILTTRGTACNFSYEGDISFSFDKNKKIQQNQDFIVKKLTDPSGGKNMFTMMEIKKELINEFLLRNNLITEFDLNTFFSSLVKTEVINDSQLTFIKKRDDFFKRTFVGFLLLKDKSGLIIPTNTIDIEIKPIGIQEDFHIRCGSLVIYNQLIAYDDIFQSEYNKLINNSNQVINIGDIIEIEGIKYIRYKKYYSDFKEKLTFLDTHSSYILVDPNEFIFYRSNSDRIYIKDLSNEVDDYDLIYRFPYALHYKKDPFPRILTIKDNFDTNLYFDYKFINSNVSSEFILTRMNIIRSSITYDRLLKDELVTDTDGNLTARQIVITNGNVEKTYNLNYNTDGTLNEEKSNVNNPIEVLTNDINKYILKFNLNTTLPIETYTVTVENGIIVRCLIKSTTDDTYRGYFDFICDNISETSEYYYKLTTDNYLSNDNKLRLTKCVKDINTEEELAEFYLEENVILEVCILLKILDRGREPQILPDPLKEMKSLTDYTLAIKFQSNKTFSFFTILNDLIDPAMDYKQEEFYSINERGIIVKQLPVVGKHYLYNYKVFQDFFNTFSIFYDVLLDNFNRLESNTSVNLKFYNTYGHSDYFTCNNTNITISLIIKLADTYSKDIDFKIKNYIMAFVENVNSNNTKIFAISNLIRELEKNFDFIQYIEFKSLDGKNNQVISYSYPSIKNMTRKQLINYIPEYLNINISKDAYIEGKENFSVGINIEYK